MQTQNKTHTIYVVRQLAYVHGRAADSYNAERKFTERLTIQSLYFSQLHSIFALSPLLFQGALSFAHSHFVSGSSCLYIGNNQCVSSLIAGLNFQTTHELQTLTHDYLQLMTDTFSTKVFKAHDYLQLLTDTFSTKVSELMITCNC